MNGLEQELGFIFMELEAGCILSKDQINTLKYACGFKEAPVDPLRTLFNDFGNIFRSGK